MQNRFEKTLFTNRIDDIKKDGIERIYYGNEFCQNLIPSLGALKRWYFSAKDKNKKFTFVTPFTTNPGLKKLQGLLSFLNTRKNIEVVFNDWGVFKLIRDNFSNLRPVLGRLLSKQRRDPRMLRILSGKQKPKEVLFSPQKIKVILYPKKIPQSLFKHYQASLINSPIFQEYILSQGIERVEVDNLLWQMDIKVDKRIRLSIYLPYGYVSTSRMCGVLTLTYAACKRECKRYFLRVEDESLPTSFYGIGNTIFYRSEAPPDNYLNKLGIDRIVTQPRLPF